jgi:hypothetical protein
MRKMSTRTAGSGRSTKKISSKRPLRSSSGGSDSMSFAVAIMKTRSLRSLIHVRSVPSTRRETPPSEPGIGRDTLLDLVQPQDAGRHLGRGLERGAQVAFGLAVELVVEGAEVQAQQRHPPRSATAFAERLLPAPWTPRRSTPFGASSFSVPALRRNASRRSSSHAFRRARPPTRSRLSISVTIVSVPSSPASRA